MPPVEARVELLAHTPNALELIYAAFRQCYHAGYVGEMWPRLLSGTPDRASQAGFVAQVLASGHASPIEHVSFTFALSGVSRALTHQLVRHRLASYSQQSQRYVDASRFEYVMPPAVAENAAARERFTRFMEEAAEAYRDLKELLEAGASAQAIRPGTAEMADARAGAKANEDARFVLPQAAETRIVATMNCRALLNFFEQRCCMRAQWEIRAVAKKMLDLCRNVLPEVFASAGAKCERLKYCPEGERFSCGRYPLALGRRCALRPQPPS
ncbi:MAG: FAD-dependent thymidylate synthase [Deltaproteobacteria bacterium]|jgi:thymidylate synthase (FAD)|nr:FAD-dependent thymidylate synthase [Deltaproteobacteria bacterium]